MPFYFKSAPCEAGTKALRPRWHALRVASTPFMMLRAEAGRVDFAV